jgi:hypothetical protein
MDDQHTAATCRWAAATLHMPAPVWLESWDRPWTCLRGPSLRPLPTTEVCASCSRWESNGLHHKPVAPHPKELARRGS